MANSVQLRISNDRWVNFAGWFVVVTYVLGALVFALLEYFGHVISARFDYPPLFIYLVSIMQILCSVALLFPRWILISLGIFTVLSLGAVGSHFRIGSPLTSLPAVAYTVIQVWLAFRIWRDSSQTDDKNPRR